MRDRATTAFCQNEPNSTSTNGAGVSRGAVRFCQNEPNLIGAKRFASGTVRFCQNEPKLGLPAPSYEIGSGRVSGEACEGDICDRHICGTGLACPRR